MSKKAVVILSILSLVFAGAAGGLWYVNNGKIEQQSTSLDKLSEFISGPTFEAKLAAPAKAVAKLVEVRAERDKNIEDLATANKRIEGLERKLREANEDIEGLREERTVLTRERDTLKQQGVDLTGKLERSESKVKDLEEEIVRQTEAAAAKLEELQTKVGADKTDLLSQLQRTRGFYAQLYNFATGKGLNTPLPAEPWNTDGTGNGPRFISNVFVSDIVNYDARQGILVLKVGSESGLLRDQTFNVLIDGKVATTVTIDAILNGALSSARILPGAPVPEIVPGTTVKLVPFVAEVTSAQAPASNPTTTVVEVVE